MLTRPDRLPGWIAALGLAVVNALLFGGLAARQLLLGEKPSSAWLVGATAFSGAALALSVVVTRTVRRRRHLPKRTS